MHLECYIDDRREDDIAESTVRNDLYLLSKIFDHAAASTRTDGPTGWRWQIDNPVRPAINAREVGASPKAGPAAYRR